MTTDKSALLPCPFCGEPDPIIDRTVSGFEAIACTKCGAWVPGDGGKNRTGIAAWNTRPQPKETPMEGEAAEALKLVKSISGGCKDGHALVYYMGRGGCPVCGNLGRLQSPTATPAAPAQDGLRERVEELERVAEAAKQWRDEYGGPLVSGELELMDALAALSPEPSLGEKPHAD